MNEMKEELSYEAQKQLEILDEYKLNSKLETFNIVHMYPKEVAYPEGYIDARFFELHIYNSRTKEKRILENKDMLMTNEVSVMGIKIFVDGSTLVQFTQEVSSDFCQCCSVFPKDYLDKYR